MNAKSITEIDEDTFNMLYQLKNYCENRRNCAECKIGLGACVIIGQDLTGIDYESISTIEIAKTGDEKYICFSIE